MRYNEQSCSDVIINGEKSTLEELNRIYTTNFEEIEEEAFDATCRLFDHESDVTVIDNEVTKIHQDDKYFTVADVRLDLRIKVTAHDIDKAIEEAEKVADEVAKRLPAGVSYVESNYYDTEKGEKAIDWDVA